VYEYAIDQFIAWYCSEPRLAFNGIVVVFRLATWRSSSGVRWRSGTLGQFAVQQFDKLLLLLAEFALLLSTQALL
jgi:hypothetical protein